MATSQYCHSLFTFTGTIVFCVVRLYGVCVVFLMCSNLILHEEMDNTTSPHLLEINRYQHIGKLGSFKCIHMSLELYKDRCLWTISYL